MSQHARIKGFGDLRRRRRRLSPLLIALVCAVLMASMPGSAQETPATFPAETFVGILHPEATIVLSAQVDGQIASFPLEIGDPVKSADLVAQIDDRVARIQRDYADTVWQDMTATELADLAIKSAGDELYRIKELGDSVARVEYEKADRAVRSAELRKQQEVARRRLAELELQIRKRLVERHRVLSAIDGVVARKFRREGEYVKEAEPIVEVIAVDTLLASVAIPSEHLAELTIGRTAVCTTDNLPGESFEGKILRRGPQIDATSRTIVVQIELDNSQGRLIPGMRVEVRFAALSE